MAKVEFEPNSGCWLWSGGINERGYGIIGLGTREMGVAKAHRVSWEQHNGPLPDGANVLHKCDTPACVNPDHLFLGTLADNARDMVRKGRNKMPDNRGERASWSKLTEADVRHIKRRVMSARAYAKRYGVSCGNISNIWLGKSWKSVECQP